MSDENIIDLEDKRTDKLVHEVKNSFDGLMWDIGEEARDLFVLTTLHSDSLGLAKDRNLTNRQLAQAILTQSAKVHDLAKRLLDAAIREDREKAS
jgi:hypothetical protein